MMTSLIRRPVGDQGWVALDLDNPGARALAVAWQADDGWRVGLLDGRTVGSKLTKTKALRLMDQTATDQLNRAGVRVLLAEVRR